MVDDSWRVWRFEGRTKYSAFQMTIGRFGRDPRILDRRADGEVVEALPLHGLAVDPKGFTHRVVEEAADAGAGYARRRRFQIQHLTDQPRLPEQAAVGPIAFLLQRPGEVRDHAEAEGALAGYGLKAAQL